MKADAEIWRCASLLIDHYGDMALNGAAIKADELARDGDPEGSGLWLRVTRAVEVLLSEETPDNATLH